MTIKQAFRRKSLVHKGIQLRFAGGVVVMAVVNALLLILAASWFYLFVLDDRMASGPDNAFLYNVGLAVAAITLLSILWSFRHTRTIIGLLKKINAVMGEAAQGKFPDGPVKFRRCDRHFSELEGHLNQCLEVMRQNTAKQQGE